MCRHIIIIIRYITGMSIINNIIVHGIPKYSYVYVLFCNVLSFNALRKSMPYVNYDLFIRWIVACKWRASHLMHSSCITGSVRDKNNVLQL